MFIENINNAYFLKQNDTATQIHLRVLDSEEKPFDLQDKEIAIVIGHEEGRYLSKTATLLNGVGELSFGLDQGDIIPSGKQWLEVHIIDSNGDRVVAPSKGFYQLRVERPIDEFQAEVTTVTLDFLMNNIDERVKKETQQAVGDAKSATLQATLAAERANTEATDLEGLKQDVTQATTDALSATLSANEKALLADEKATLADIAAIHAESVAIENKTRFLNAVATVALRNSTYPNPTHGDTVRVTSEAKTYRFVEGTGWVITDEYNPTAIDQVTQQLADTEKDLTDRGPTIKHLGAIGDGVTNDTDVFTQAFDNYHTVVVTEGTYVIDGLFIPDEKTLVTIGEVTFLTTGTIELGTYAVMECPGLHVDASAVTTDEFSIIKLGRSCRVVIKSITGYRSGSTRGDGTVAKAFDATYTDFINVTLLGRIRRCRYGLYLNAGASGSGNTINGSYFFIKHIGQCKYGIYHTGSTMSQIEIKTYIELCDIGFSASASIYGIHNAVFDDVTQWFENRSTSHKTRYGVFHIPNRTMGDVLEQLNGEFYDTRFICRDGTISSRPSTAHEPTLQSDQRSKLRFKSGNAEIRLVSSGSNSYENKYSVNDTSNGISNTIGHLTAQKYIIENSNDELLFSVDGTGTVRIEKHSIEVMNSSSGLVLHSPDGSRWRLTIANTGEATWRKI